MDQLYVELLMPWTFTLIRRFALLGAKTWQVACNTLTTIGGI